MRQRHDGADSRIMPTIYRRRLQRHFDVLLLPNVSAITD